jgi:signal transduction histidine kinase
MTETDSRPSPSTLTRLESSAIDIVIAAGAFAAMLALVITGGVGGDPSASNANPFIVLLVAASTLPLVARRDRPFAVFVVTIVASTILYAVQDPNGPPIGPTLAIFFLGSAPDEQRPRVWVMVALALAMMVMHTLGGAFAEFLLGAALWSGAFLAGDRVRIWRDRITEFEERALRAEREAEQDRRLAVAEERTRIARDLHDSAAHAINVILVQAGAARLLSDRDPERSRAALEIVEDVARDTLGDIDRIVRALRVDGDGAAPPEVEPPPGLAALPMLVARHSAAGMHVDVATHGTEQQLSRGVDQTAYRILQEALTNAARHGEGAAGVDLTFGADGLEIVVTNPVTRERDVSTTGGSHGLIGMRERAGLLGGTLETEAGEGRFRVHATLPSRQMNGAAP